LTNSTTNNASTPGYIPILRAPLTFVMTFTHNAANGIDVTATIDGRWTWALATKVFLFQSATDATPNGFLFDTFGIRPSTNADTAKFLRHDEFQSRVHSGSRAVRAGDADPRSRRFGFDGDWSAEKELIASDRSSLVGAADSCRLCVGAGLKDSRHDSFWQEVERCLKKCWSDGRVFHRARIALRSSLR